MNQHIATGKFEQMKGAAKQSVGEAIGNEKLANSGVVDQVKGAVEETWGQIKDTAHTISEDAKARAEAKHSEASLHATQKAHDLREKIGATTQNAKNAVAAKLDEVKERHQRSA